MDCFTSLDYMDEFIRSRLVNTCLLISICGPLLNWLYLLSPIDKYGVTLFSMYFVLALAVCLFILNPGQLANKLSSTNCCQFFISIMTMICLLVYEITLIIVNINSTEIEWNTHEYLYSAQIFYFMSIVSTVFVIFYYMITLMKLCKNKETNNGAFNLEKYIQLKHIYQQIKNTKSNSDLSQVDREDIEHRELNHTFGCCYLLYQFLWPTVDNKKYVTDCVITYYPSRLFFAIYLGLFGTVILFELQVSAHLWLHTQLDLLQSYMESIAGIVNGGWYVWPQSTVDAMYFAIDYIHWLKTLLLAFTHGLLFGSITALIITSYSSIVLFKAWNKKLINMRRETPTFRYNEKNENRYSVWSSSNLIASITMYFIIGYIYLTILLIVIFGFMIYLYFWKITLPIYWPLFIIFLLYYVFIDNFIFKKFLIDSNGSIRKADNKFFEKCFKLLLIINDFMNFPMALLKAIFRVTCGIVFTIVSYLRPDISIFPRGLKHRDMAHAAFVASIRLIIEREKEYLIRYQQQYTKHCSNDDINIDQQNIVYDTTKGSINDNTDNSTDFHAL